MGHNVLIRLLGLLKSQMLNATEFCLSDFHIQFELNKNLFVDMQEYFFTLYI